MTELTGWAAAGLAGVVVRWCAPCGDETFFEVPPCEDGHGEDCLDLCCVQCGHALVVGVLAGQAEPALGALAA